jgi:hypothetical protein
MKVISVVFIALLAVVVVLSFIGIGQCMGVGQLDLTVDSPGLNQDLVSTNSEALLLPLEVHSNADFLSGEITYHGNPVWAGSITPNQRQTVALTDYRELLPDALKGPWVDLVLKVRAERKPSRCEAATWFKLEAGKVETSVTVPFSFIKGDQKPSISLVSAMSNEVSGVLSPTLSILIAPPGTHSVEVQIKTSVVGRKGQDTQSTFITKRERENIVMVTLPMTMTKQETLNYELTIGNAAGTVLDKGILSWIDGKLSLSRASTEGKDSLNPRGVPVWQHGSEPATVIPDWHGILINFAWIIGFIILGAVVTVVAGRFAPTIMSAIGIVILVLFLVSMVAGFFGITLIDSEPSVAIQATDTPTVTPSPTPSATRTPTISNMVVTSPSSAPNQTTPAVQPSATATLRPTMRAVVTNVPVVPTVVSTTTPFVRLTPSIQTILSPTATRTIPPPPTVTRTNTPLPPPPPASPTPSICAQLKAQGKSLQGAWMWVQNGASFTQSASYKFNTETLTGVEQGGFCQTSNGRWYKP